MNFLVLTDFHYEKNKATSMEIFPSAYSWSNNLDPTIFNKMLTQIKDAVTTGTIATPNFILILGDLTGYELTNSDIYNDIKDVLTGISDGFPNIPRILVFGNNDSLSDEYDKPGYYDYGPFYATTPVSGAHSTYEIAKQIGWANGFLSTGIQCSATKTYPCLINENTTYGFLILTLRKIYV